MGKGRGPSAASARSAVKEVTGRRLIKVGSLRNFSVALALSHTRNSIVQVFIKCKVSKLTIAVNFTVSVVGRFSLKWTTRWSHSNTIVVVIGLVAVLEALVLQAVGAHLFQPLCVRCADEVRLHVVDAALGVHEVLVILALDLDHAHHDAVDHVDRLAFVVFALTLADHAILALFDVLDTLAVHTVFLLVEHLLLALGATIIAVVVLLVQVVLARAAAGLIADFFPADQSVVTSIVLITDHRAAAVVGVHLVLAVDKVIESPVVAVYVHLLSNGLSRLVCAILKEDGVGDGTLALAFQRR